MILQWIVALVINLHPQFSEQTATRIANEGITVCEIQTGTLEERPFMDCILRTVPEIIESEKRDE